MQSILDLCQGLPEQSFATGETLLPEGGKTGRLYILIEGEVEVRKGDLLMHVGTEPGAVYGEIAALLDIPHTATLKTRQPSRFHVVQDAAAFLRANPELTYGVCKLMARRLYVMTTYLADLKHQFADHGSHLGMIHEILSSLMHHSDEPFEPGSDRYPDRSL